MTALPGFLLRHTVTVRPYEGDSAYGPRYGDPVTVRCFLEQKIRTVRGKTGEEVVSSGTFYARLADAETTCVAESKVTLPDASETLIIAALPRNSGGLPTPDHLEVQLI